MLPRRQERLSSCAGSLDLMGAELNPQHDIRWLHPLQLTLVSLAGADIMNGPRGPFVLSPVIPLNETFLTCCSIPTGIVLCLLFTQSMIQLVKGDGSLGFQPQDPWNPGRPSIPALIPYPVHCFFSQWLSLPANLSTIQGMFDPLVLSDSSPDWTGLPWSRKWTTLPDISVCTESFILSSPDWLDEKSMQGLSKVFYQLGPPEPCQVTLRICSHGWQRSMYHPSELLHCIPFSAKSW